MSASEGAERRGTGFEMLWMSVRRRLMASLIAQGDCSAGGIAKVRAIDMSFLGVTRQVCTSTEVLQLRLLPYRWVQVYEVVQ